MSVSHVLFCLIPGAEAAAGIGYSGMDLVVSSVLSSCLSRVVFCSCGIADIDCQPLCWLIRHAHVGTSLWSTVSCFFSTYQHVLCHANPDQSACLFPSRTCSYLALSCTPSWPLLQRQHRLVLASWTDAAAATLVVTSTYFFTITDSRRTEKPVHRRQHRSLRRPKREQSQKKFLQIMITVQP